MQVSTPEAALAALDSMCLVRVIHQLTRRGCTVRTGFEQRDGDAALSYRVTVQHRDLGTRSVLSAPLDPAGPTLAAAARAVARECLDALSWAEERARSDALALRKHPVRPHLVSSSVAAMEPASATARLAA